VVSEVEGFRGQSWIVQYEVIEEEPPPPPNEDGIPPAFDFFGLGQPGPGPFNPLNAIEDDDMEIEEGWEPWAQHNPDASPAAAENALLPPVMPDLNEFPEFDNLA
jgi:hypothetical protein